MISIAARPQVYPLKGQLASTAFPICGEDTIQQTSVPNGFNAGILMPGCDPYTEINPFYYRFTCFTSGSLVFTITPNDPSDNYDWILFDITGRLPSDIFVDPALTIVGNRSGTPGPTGVNAGAPPKANCFSSSSSNISAFTISPNIIKGHDYLLLVTHELPKQSGYSLEFSGSTAVLNDPNPPALSSVVVSCDKKTLTVGISKFILCKSLAADGSDFTISNYSGTITSAVGLNCSPQFDMNYLELSLSNPLTPGKYSLTIQSGSDNNTLMDYCGVQSQPGNQLNFTVAGVQPTLDSLAPVSCQPAILHLIFSNPIQCASVAADGSDFVVTGASVIAVKKAEGNCAGNMTTQIDLTLSAPVTTEGNYQISVQNGSDGNTLTNACGFSVAPGSSLPFTIGATVTAAFDYSIAYGCAQDTIIMKYLPAGSVNQSDWSIDSSFVSSLISPSVVETIFGLKQVRHIVSNGFCSDTIFKTVNLDNLLKAGFQAPDVFCPKNEIAFKNTSIGNIVSYDWDFGDGSTSRDAEPPKHLFAGTGDGKNYQVRLTVQNELGCRDSAITQMTRLATCSLSVPNAFTPNGDGKNDWLYPLNAFDISNYEFQVFNRFGQLVFTTRDPQNKWDGRVNGQLQETGTYVWFLSYTDGSGKRFSQKGSTLLIR